MVQGDEIKMSEREESSMDVRDKEGKIIGAICVLKGKNLQRNDIIFMPLKGDAFSVRSTVELINKISKFISYKELKMIIEFIARRLLYLDKKKEMKEL